MWFAVKTMDYNREQLEKKALGVYIESSPKISPCWCPICREGIDIHQLQDIKNIIKEKKKEYSTILKIHEDEKKCEEEEWKKDVERRSKEDIDNSQCTIVP